MRKYFFESLALLLILGSLGFFVECVVFLGRHEYIAGAVIALVAFAVLRVGAELARLALAERE